MSTGAKQHGTLTGLLILQKSEQSLTLPVVLNRITTIKVLPIKF